MLPSDANYKSSAPIQVQQLQCFKQMLKDNLDPYASHSFIPELCQQLEMAAGVPIVVVNSEEN
jgi:hypothetical protein